MKVTLIERSGMDSAMMSLYISKGHLDKYRELRKFTSDAYSLDEYLSTIDELENKVFKYGQKHLTILRFLDFTFLVEGMHRAGQDDWDSHAKRFDNRIIRLSTRYTKVPEGSVSDFYKGKIVPTGTMLKELDIPIPPEVNIEGVNYVKTDNGYVREDLAEDQDVLRGLYMLSLPSTFIFKVNLAEFAHVFRMRSKYSNAHPEVKDLCEQCVDLIHGVYPQVDRAYLFNARD